MGIVCTALLGFRPLSVCIVADIVIALDCVLSLRRALLLSASSLIYRPPLGSLEVVSLREIIAVQRTVTVSGTTLIARPGAPGIRITTAGSFPLVFPLSVHNASELIVRLETIVSSR